MTMRAMEAPPRNVKGLAVAGSPFSTGVLVAERVFRGNGHRGHSRSWVDLMSEEETSSLGSKTDTEDKEEGTKEEEMMTTAAQSPVVMSRRDIATQMSPEEISPKNLNCLSVIEPPLREIPCRGEVREVKMDKGGAKMVKRPKRRVMLSSTCRVIRRDNSEEAEASSWDISEPSMTLSNAKRGSQDSSLGESTEGQSGSCH